MKIKFDFIDLGLLFALIIAILLCMFGCDNNNIKSEYIVITPSNKYYVNDYIIKNGVLHLNDLKTNEVYVVSGNYTIKPNLYN